MSKKNKDQLDLEEVFYVQPPSIKNNKPIMKSAAASNQEPRASATNSQGALKSDVKKKWKILQQYASEKRKFILKIGQAGASKTVISASVVYHAMQKLGTLPNPIDDPSGARYLSKVIKSLAHGKFPPGNAEGSLEFYDVGIYFNQEPTWITIIEIAGESLKQFDPENNYRDPFFKEFETFLKLKPNLITFLVAPANEAKQLDLYFQFCIAHLRALDPLLTEQLGLIISKWDLYTGTGVEKKNRPLNPFIKKNMPTTNRSLNLGTITKRFKVFRFTVGEVEDDQIVDGLNLKYCDPILDWIAELLIRIPAKRKVEELDREVDKSKEVIYQKEQKHKELDEDLIKIVDGERPATKKKKKRLFGNLNRFF